MPGLAFGPLIIPGGMPVAKWTLTVFDSAGDDAGGNRLNIYGPAKHSQKATATGDVVLTTTGEFIRICGDTACHFKVGAGAADTDPYIPAGQEFVIALNQATTVSLA